MKDLNSHVDEVLLETIVREMVEFPDEVRVERTMDELGVLLSLHVAKIDMGKVIGVSGANAKALRVILRCVGMKNNARINLKIVEPAPAPEPLEKTTLEDLDKHLDL